MKKYIEKNELATLFFVHYFKYTRYAFKKIKSDEDKAAINAHRTLMRMFGAWHNEGRVLGSDVINAIKLYVIETKSTYLLSTMTQSTLHDRLDTLGLKGFKSSLIRQCDDPNYGQLPFNDRLLQLLDAEINERENRKIKRLMQNSAIKDKQASLENIEYSSKRGVERSHILSLATCDYIDKGQNILITGATGVGKSFLAQALAKRAIHQGLSAVYYRVSRLLEEIKLARLEGTYTKTIQKLSKHQLPILDDFGVTPLKSDELNDLFEVIEERTLGGSTIITAQLPVKEWHAYLGNETIADAMMDRLIYSAHRIEMKGESMRKTLAQK